MSFLSRILTVFGLILLAHAGYSAHEYTTLYDNIRNALTASATTTTNNASSQPTLPLDIVIEALVALSVVSLGFVLGAEKLKPVSWSMWAGEIEREGGARNPYLFMEERYGFWDVRTKRKEFADWIRGKEE